MPKNTSTTPAKKDELQRLKAENESLRRTLRAVAAAATEGAE